MAYSWFLIDMPCKPKIVLFIPGLVQSFHISHSFIHIANSMFFLLQDVWIKMPDRVVALQLLSSYWLAVILPPLPGILCFSAIYNDRFSASSSGLPPYLQHQGKYIRKSFSNTFIIGGIIGDNLSPPMYIYMYEMVSGV